MKKLTPRFRGWLLNRQRRWRRSHFCRSPHVITQRLQEAEARFNAIRTPLGPAIIDYQRRAPFATIVPPKVFSLQDNYAPTVAFILDMRRYFAARGIWDPAERKQKRIFADFAEIENIEPAAGLMLAAEIDRWRRLTGQQPRMWDAGWNPSVKRYFVQAGLFELLGVSQQEELPVAPPEAVETIRFVQGRAVSAEAGSRLRDQLETLCGASIGPRRTVYDAIAEAIANTRHAYPTDMRMWPARADGRWWASGTWAPATNTVSVQLYDQGVGIPATLPRSEHWSDVIKLAGLGQRLHPERDDHRLMEAALAIGRTSTGVQGRGKGLAEMAAWIERRGNGSLRLRSGRGIVVYRSGGTVDGRLGPGAFPGTLIEWEVGLSG